MSYGHVLGALVCSFVFSSSMAQSVYGVTFAREPGVIYVPLRETAKALGILVDWDSSERKVVVDDKKYDEDDFSQLYDGTKLVPLREFAKFGATVELDRATDVATVKSAGSTVEVVLAPKHVEVSISDQTLRAWQGDLLVMETNISSGRRGHSTPRGKFKAGPVKDRMHYSRLYNNSPMPYSVQIHGHVFIHGYHSVPPRPASHGCIRMPLKRKNAAKFFFDWVDVGTPVWILSEFSDGSERLSAKK